MPNQSLYLFVYGSLRKGFQHEAYHYIKDYFSFVKECKVKGRLYDVGEYPAAIATDAEEYITGELYKADSEAKFQWAIAQLDDYEGLTIEVGETALYKRSIVELVDDEYNKAWIYWYNLPHEHLPVIESGDYLKYIQDKERK